MDATKKNVLANAIKDATWLEDAKWRQANADWLDLSAAIAMKILRFLRENKITQKELADRLGFSPQYVNKIVKGSENLTLETISKIEKALDFQLINVQRYEEVVHPKTTKPMYNSLTVTHKRTCVPLIEISDSVGQERYECCA